MAASLIALMDSLLIEPVASSSTKGIFGKGVSEKKGGLLLLLAVLLLLKTIYEEGVMRARR